MLDTSKYINNLPVSVKSIGSAYGDPWVIFDVDTALDFMQFPEIKFVLGDNSYSFKYIDGSDTTVFLDAVFTTSNNNGGGSATTPLSLKKGETGQVGLIQVEVMQYNPKERIVEIKIKDLSLGVSASCIDSDGGINYLVKGQVIGPSFAGEPTNGIDSCQNGNVTGLTGTNLLEWNCKDSNFAKKIDFECPNGCSDGACLPISNGVCTELINQVAFSQTFNVAGINFKSSYSQFYENSLNVNGVEEPVKDYYSSWDGFGGENDPSKYYHLSMDILIFDNENVDLKTYLNEMLSYKICTTSEYWGENGLENTIYICNWDTLHNRQNLDNYDSKSREIIWYNNNVLVKIDTYTGIYLTDEQLAVLSAERFNQFVNDIIDNQGTFLGWDFFGLDYPFSEIVSNKLSTCSSDIVNVTCNPDWKCNIEPAICPPHGYQTKNCVDYACDQTREETIDCNPGICSGCLIPKWFGDKWSSNKCIPYGFRFEQSTGDFTDMIIQGGFSETLPEFEDDSVKLVVESSSRAVLTFNYPDNVSYEYILTPGAEIVLDAPEFDNYIEFKLLVGGINYNPEGNSSVDVKITYSYMGQEYTTFNAYCDLDGVIKVQKKATSAGWAKCQNSYECDSNVCSSGECIEVTKMIQETSRFKQVAVKILCRFIHPFSEENYNSCVSDALGITSAPTGGSGGGSSSG
jgi:hypothetical protein